MPEISATIRIADAFSSPLDKLSAGLSRVQSGFSRLKGSLSGNAFSGAEKSSSGLFKSMAGGVVVGNLISKGMGLASSGVRSMIGELNEASTSWQTFEGNMHQLGASDTQISKAKADMQKFAQQTIYSASDMSSTYAQLAAVGTKNTAQLVKGFGGLAAASDNPQQAMKTLSEQATQMAAKPLVQWQDFKLMLEQTPAGISAVAKTMGESTTQLIKDIQDGKVKTEDFLNAVAKTGTNANFSKMATQYKTVGQAMDGLKETLANKLQPQFDKVGKVGIKAVEGITDRLGKLNFDSIGDSIANTLSKIDVNQIFDNISNAYNRVKPILENIKNAISDVFQGFQSSGALSAVGQAFGAIADSITSVTSKISGFQGGNFFTNIGKLAGSGISAVAGIITNIANAIGRMSPGQIKAVGAAIASFAGSLMLLKGVDSVAGTISSIASGLSLIKGGFGSAFKGVSELPASFGKASKGMSTFFGDVKKEAAASSAFNFSEMLGGSADLAGGMGGILGKIEMIKGAFTALAPSISGALSAVFSPIGAIIGGVTVLVVGAVSAWKQNFMGFRDTVQQTFGNFGQVIGQAFSGLGQALAPIGQVFGQIGQAIQPAIPAAKQFVTALGAIAGTGVLVGLAMVVDIFKNIVSGVTAAFSAVKGFVQGLHGIGDAVKDIAHGDFSFSSARKTFADAGKAFSNAQKNFHPLDFSTTEKTIGTAIRNAQKSASGKKVKLKTDVDTSNVKNKLSNATKGNKKVKVGAKFDAAQLNKQMDAISKKKIQTPKVKAPKIPQPKMPKAKTMPAPKVKTPKVPQPKMPKLKTIPAPKVQKPNMSGVVSAVRSGMSKAAAAARAGGAQISAAVRSALNQAVAAARSAAGAMQAAGVMIGQGLANGIRSQVGAVAAAANELVAQANRAARAAAQIHSPSRLFAEVGSFIGQGMAVGMDSTRGLISQSSRAMINSAYPGSYRSVNGLNTVGSSSLKPNSYNTNNYNGGGTTSSSEVNIAPGAIVINSSGNPEQDAETLLEMFEQKIIELDDKSLS